MDFGIDSRFPDHLFPKAGCNAKLPSVVDANVIFMFLDAYYLGQEEHYKRIHRQYLKDAKDGNYENTYVINDTTVCETISLTLSKLGSLSVLPFYIGLGALSVVLYFILNNPQLCQ